ncbi:MAG: aminotransferase class V-fold PLP-dependent enzyme [Alphaproteobacteria bacterium]|nr:aminotransferase class V-fold PLP-dependent enzyme [Alphaproteobacteria bacterium]
MNKIIYLDAAASYQKSNAVIDARVDFLRNKYANSGRGICARAVDVDNMLENTRRVVADFIGANAQQIVFTAGTTDAMNMIARMLAGRVVAVSDLDHHSARLPFEQLAREIKVCPLNQNLDIDLNDVPVADVMVITAMSNVLGRAQDVKKIIAAAREKNPNVITVVDAAQYVVHNDIDVSAWGCDFLCWSGHKIGADTGVGVLYIKNPDDFAPVKFGGGMVNKIIGNDLILNNAPDKFEAGTLPLTQISALGVAIE